MKRDLPAVIARSGISDEPVNHGWDDNDPEFAYVGSDERMQNRISQISDRGVLALSAGTAEWIAWRFHKLTDEPLLFNKVDAIWAGTIDWHYLSTAPLPPRKDWQGPIRGPVRSAARWLDRMVQLLRREEFAYPEAVSLGQLMLFVTAKPDLFKDWRRFAVGQLTKLYAADKTNVLGAPVPREALDPDTQFDPAAAPAQLDRFLRGLDPTGNPFLATPDEMIAAGFTGTPYTYS
jgi:hypothetical protein